jgi:hypothetical protein
MPKIQLNLRDQCSSVLLPPANEQKVMIIGGGSQSAGNPNTPPLLNQPATRDVRIIDLSVFNPTYVETGQLNFGRIHLNAVLLPDRTVFVCGGNKIGDPPSMVHIGDEPVLQSEIYNPATKTWTETDTAKIARKYHAVALLLPDGRVLSAGSNPDRRALIKESCNNTSLFVNHFGDNEIRLEIFSPPYLFQGPRPEIQYVQQELTYGGKVDIHMLRADEISWIHIIRPMATTHSFDSEQRLVDLPFERIQHTRLRATVPDNPDLVPPGWYMLFIVRSLSDDAIPRGVPSIAKWVHLAVPLRTITGPLTSYVSGTIEHIAGIGSNGHVYMFFYIPATASATAHWDFIDVTVDQTVT